MSEHDRPSTEAQLRMLQERLTEAEDMLEAIRSGQIDALLIGDDGHEQVFTLAGADQPYRIMIEQMQEGALTLTADGIVMYCNRRLAELSKLPIHKVIGSRFTALFHEEDVPEVQRRLHTACREKVHFETRLRQQSAGAIPVLVSACPFDVDGHANVCVTVTNLDALVHARRESKELKESTQKLELKVAERTALLQHQAQRLRMLALQLSDAEQRERKRLAEIIHDHLQQLLVAAKMRLDRLARDHSGEGIDDVQRLLQESLNCARSLTTELRPPVLYEDGLLAAIQWLSQHTKSQYDVEVATCLEPQAEPADDDVKAFLYQSVRELLFNAIKHAGVRELRIVVDIDDANCTRVVVEDEGNGFDATAVRDRHAVNTSIGLFSIQERIAALSGSMDIVSEPGRGTHVTLTVPRKFVEEKPPRATQRGVSSTKTRRNEPVGDAIRVVLVDDHQLVREGLGNLLKEHAGIAVVGMAENGQEAILRAGELRPDVVLMDANMPLMNGIEATRNIRASYPDIQVVGLSVQNDDALRDSFHQAGAAAFLSKDGDLHCLFETILNCRSVAQA